MLLRNLAKRIVTNPSKYAQKKRAVLLSDIPKASFFWNRKKKEAEPQESDEITQEDMKSWKNLRYILDEALQANKAKPTFLPPSVTSGPSNVNKLTVVMELDEVLAHVFTPDEQEGYLLAPSRYVEPC